ncbi:MAG: PQQ-binding-like beta-propeller repeat protein, partial [Gammaproteobacteria bacterium]
QHMPNDQWDLDWVYERQIVELGVNGVSRKVIVTAGKMALYDALDAATGDYLFSVDVGLQNIVTAIDPQTGAKTLHPNAIPNSEEGHLLCPFAVGGRNWPSAAVNPNTKMLYVPLAELCMMFGPTSDNPGLLSTGVPMEPRPLPDTDGNFGRLQAINLETGELAWNYRETLPPASAALATAGGLVFLGGLNKELRAHDDATGEVLWRTELGDIPGSFPISYEVNGRQYIAVVVGQISPFHSSVFLQLMDGFLGDNNPARDMKRAGPALEVYGLN